MTDQERAMRFGYLLSEIEIGARAMLDGDERDIVVAMMRMARNVEEASMIALEVSRESLDKVTKDAGAPSTVQAGEVELGEALPPSPPNHEA